jgi:hypothetical protein
MSWKPEIQTVNGDGFYPNATAFETKAEAEAAGRDILGRWMLATAYRAVESDQAPNYRIVEGRMEPIPCPSGW